MTFEYIHKSHNKSLVIVFAGWGMDSHPFEDLHVDECDIAVAYNYADFRGDNISSGYDNVYVFAWSFGVFAAARWLYDNNINPTIAVAINGTLSPVDDTLGISVGIFRATLDSLSEDSLVKFQKRMCGIKGFAEFRQNPPERTIDSLRDELVEMDRQKSKTDCLFRNWNIAYIADNDRIFPPQNQDNAWSRTSAIRLRLKGQFHRPDSFQAIIDANIIDKRIVKTRFEKSQPLYDSYAQGQARIAQRLMQMWSTLPATDRPTVLEIGCGTGIFTRLYTPNINPGHVFLNDLTDIPESLITPQTTVLKGDAETIDIPDNIDFAVSTSAIQWFNNPKRFICNIAKHLAPDGYLILSTFGTQNYCELRQSFASSLVYHSADNWREIVTQAGLTPVDISEESFTMTFDSIAQMLTTLRQTGVNAVKTPSQITKSTILELERNIPTIDGKYGLTFNPIYIIAKNDNRQ